VPGFAFGGIVPGPRGLPQLIVAHGDERVQTPAQRQSAEPTIISVAPVYHFHGGPPKTKYVEWTLRELDWRIARKGGRA
jgi:hypothetical protein